MDVQKINSPGITVALQNEFSKCQEQVSLTQGKTEENWAKLKNEADAAVKLTSDIFKRHYQD